MASLIFYVKKFGKREGKKRYNAYQSKYRRIKKNRDRINARQRERREAMKQALIASGFIHS